MGVRVISICRIACLVVLLSSALHAQQERLPLLHPLFADHAVVQRDQPLRVWGWAPPGRLVRVQVDDEAPVSVRANEAGHWRASLPPLGQGGPHTITAAEGDRKQVVTDILAGDVFVCAGQSNMEFPTRLATNGAAILEGPFDSRLRLLQVSRRIAEVPQASLEARDQWVVDSAEAAGHFSAVCYLFGRALMHTQRVPIGLIHASWGGTRIEAWMSASALRAAGHGAELQLIADHARNPELTEARFAEQFRQWWRQRDMGFRARWNSIELEDQRWESIRPSGFWEDSGERRLVGWDGIVWFRSEFELSAAEAVQGGRLELGPADDIDVTFLNDREVGSVTGWDTPRSYAIEPGVLRAGRNVLATSVLDTGGGGGFWGPSERKFLRLADGSTIALARPWRYRLSASLDELGAIPRRPWGGPNSYAALYNGMIAPLSGFEARAVLWYQGEANADAPQAYERLLPAMFADWRQAMENPSLEFYVVQLASFGAPVAGGPVRDGWGRIREVQRRVVSADHHAALAVSLDLGDRHDIHPTQKLVLAERLARIARRRLYGEAIEAQGPYPVRATRDHGRIIVAFTNDPLVLYSAARPMSVELCTAKRVCRFVDARVDGAQMLIDESNDADRYVRYCWGDGPICNLFNEHDLPAVPFELAIE